MCNCSQYFTNVIKKNHCPEKKNIKINTKNICINVDLKHDQIIFQILNNTLMRKYLSKDHFFQVIMVKIIYTVGSHSAQCHEYPRTLGDFFTGGSRQQK